MIKFIKVKRELDSYFNGFRRFKRSLISLNVSQYNCFNLG